MSETSYQNRNSHPSQFNFGNSGSLPYASRLSSSENDGYTSRILSQPGVHGKKIFGFEIFVDNDILNELSPLQEWFSKVQSSGAVESIRFNLDLNIPDLNGRNIQIYDNQMEKKYQSCRVFLNDIYQIFKKVRREPFSIIIFVPEGMVSLLIGTKGYQINKIMRESHTTIVVNQPISRMTYRTVKIQGYHSDISRACRIIYEILEEKSSIAYSIQKQPSQLDYSKARVKTKFIICATILNYLLTKKRNVLRKIEEETKCLTKYRQDTSSSLLKRDEELCVVFGKLEDVQAYIVMLINLIQINNDEDRKSHQYNFKMLIPSNYVTKLIGQKGYMIRDIIERSGGAQIKILSDRQSDRDTRQCIIAINGTRQNKIDATCLILQQIQCFKNGGPILQSGKSINQNLAQQFKNSLPLHASEDILEQLEIPFKAVSFIDKIVVQGNQNKDVKWENQVAVSYRSPIKEHQQGKFEEENRFVGVVELKQYHKSQIIDPVTYPESLKASKSEYPPQIMQLQEGQQAGTYSDQKIKEPYNFVSDQRNILSDNRYDDQQKRLSYQSPSKHSDKSRSPSSRSHRKPRRITQNRSSSPEYQQDKQFVQVKLVLPRKLAQDHKQLKYIESLSGSNILVREQRVQGSGETIISIRGTLRNNSQCIKLLQKRIMRLAPYSSYSR